MAAVGHAEKPPLLCDFVGSMYRVFYDDRINSPRNVLETWKHRTNKQTLKHYFYKYLSQTDTCQLEST